MRLCASVMYRRCRARVIATYIRRRSSSSPDCSRMLFVREQALFQAGDEDRVELQALGGMHRHELDRVLALLRLVVAGFQRRVRQEGASGVMPSGATMGASTTPASASKTHRFRGTTPAGMPS